MAGKLKSKGIVRSQSGAALVFTACILAVILSLSLAALLSAQVLMSSSQKRLGEERARIAATSLRQTVKRDLTKSWYETASGFDSSLYAYLKKEMAVFGSGDWTYYNADEAFHTDLEALTRSFALENAQEGVESWLELYWESDKASMENSDVNKRYDGVVLTVSVCCRIQQETYKIKTQYMLTDSLYGARWYMPEGS